MAGPNLLAPILVSKFDDHLPLYRQHEIFERMGGDIPESTLVGWCGRARTTLSALIERIDANTLGRTDIMRASTIGSEMNCSKERSSIAYEKHK